MQTHKIPKHVKPSKNLKYQFFENTFRWGSVTLENGNKLETRDGSVFIYILIPNSPLKKSLRVPNIKVHIPFYVGQTKSVNDRFNNHEQVAWHYGKFSQKVKIMVIACVREEFADYAERSLIKLLTDAGILLNNKQNNPAHAHFYDLESYFSLEKYYKEKKNGSPYINQWRMELPEGALIDIPIVQENPIINQNLLKEDLMKVINRIASEKISSADREIALKISQSYNFSKKEAKVLLTKEEKLAVMKQKPCLAYN
jgi:hypothetical protein